MKIPKSFKLFAQTIKVVKNGEPFIENASAFGFASYQTNKIHLNYKLKSTKKMMEQVFLHDLMHFVVYFAEGCCVKDEQYLHANEEFVDLMSNLLHQALVTMEY